MGRPAAAPTYEQECVYFTPEKKPKKDKNLRSGQNGKPFSSWNFVSLVVFRFLPNHKGYEGPRRNTPYPGYRPVM